MQGRRDLARVRAFMDAHAIDVGVFQEVETRASRGGTLQDIETLAGPDRPYHLPGLAMHEGTGWYGNLIVSRYPIVSGVVHDLTQKMAWEPRNAVDAVIMTPSGPIRVIGTHLSLAPWERWSEAQKLVQLMAAVETVEKGPTLLMGDVNEWRSPLWSRLLRHLDGIMTPIPCGPTFPARRPYLNLDRVWCGHMPKIPTVQTCISPETRLLSDHLPVLVEYDNIGIGSI